jgi:hypothetical protein
MIQVVQGDTVRIPATFEDGLGALTDPTGPTIDVLDPTGAVIVNDAALVRDSIGQYHYDYAVPGTASIGVWIGRFSGTIQGAVYSGDEPFQVFTSGALPAGMNPILSISEYKTAVGLPLSDTSQDAKIEQAINFASTAIRNYTRRDFATAITAATTRRYPYDGKGLVDVDDLVTGSVTAVAIVPWGTASGLVLNPDDFSVEPSDPGAEVQSWIELTPGLGVDPLGEGFLRNMDSFGAMDRVQGRRGYLDVTARFGWEDVPGDVKQAAIWTTAAFIENPKPFLSRSVAEVSVTYPNPTVDAIPLRAQALLDGYIKPRIAA